MLNFRNLLALFCLHLFTSHISALQLGRHGHRPECRKAGVAVWVPDADLNSLSLQASVTHQRAKGHSNNNSHHHNQGSLFVWAGKGNHRDLIFSNAYLYDIWRGKWEGPLKQTCIATTMRKGCELPSSRWKVFASYLSGLGATLIFGGSTRPHAYFNDMWLMWPQGEESITWEEARIRGREAPEGRRAFGGAIIDEDSDRPMVAIGMGRDGRGNLLQDMWLGEIHWPDVTWRKVWQGTTTNNTNTHQGRCPEPPPRRGHAMVYVPDAFDPVLVILGGRTTNDAGYYMDVWAFHLDSLAWEDWTPEEGPLVTGSKNKGKAPESRDHFQATYYKGSIYFFGGRGGESYNVSQPLGDLWKFDIAEKSWIQLEAGDKRPKPRFLATTASVGEKGSLLVFGGETTGPPDAALLDSRVQGHAGSFDGCYLNDAWLYNVETNKWTELSAPQWCTRRCARYKDDYDVPQFE